MQAVELALGQTYIYRGQIFKAGVVYEVNDDVAKDLLTKVTQRGLNHFRIVMLEKDTEVEKPAEVESDAKPLPDFEADAVKAVPQEEPQAEEDEVKKSNVTVRRTKRKRTAAV